MNIQKRDKMKLFSYAGIRGEKDYIGMSDGHWMMGLEDGRIRFEVRSKEEVTGFCYERGRGWCTVKGRNALYCFPAGGEGRGIVFDDYRTIRVLKYLSFWDDDYFVIEGIRKDRVLEIFLWQREPKKKWFVFPITNHFYDFHLPMAGTGYLLCEDESCYRDDEDDDYDYDYTFLMKLDYDRNQRVTRKDAIVLSRMYDSFDDKYHEKLFYYDRMRFPLFDYYFYHWLKLKSISLHGHSVISYSEDLDGVVLGSIVDGEVEAIVKNEDDWEESDQYYYNEETSILTVAGSNGSLKRYLILIPEKKYEALNKAYNRACREKRLVRNDPEFEALLLDAMDSTHCITRYPKD